MRAPSSHRERLWGGPAPITVVDFDDFIIWITLGIILGGRIGYVLFYNLPHFAAHPLEIFELWNGGMSFHGGVARLRRRHRLCLRCAAALPMLSLGDVTTAVAPIGLFLGRIANFINGELWGRPTDVPWAMIFPNGGPIPRHPSQLYEAALEGVVLLSCSACWCAWARSSGPASSPALSLSAMASRASSCEFFREPDVQLGFLWGGLTMGMLLCIPLILAGIGLLAFALTRQPIAENMADEPLAARKRNPPADRRRRADAGCRIYAALPDASAIRLLHHPRSDRRRAAISSPRPRSARCSAS